MFWIYRFYRAHEWDRDEQEFFRYTPNVKPYKQVFPLEGIAVDVSWTTNKVSGVLLILNLIYADRPIRWWDSLYSRSKRKNFWKVQMWNFSWRDISNSSCWEIDDSVQ